MYDDAARGSMRPHHWYDEPPYESDPDDFLMAGINSGPAAIIQVCLMLHSSLYLLCAQNETFDVRGLQVIVCICARRLCLGYEFAIFERILVRWMLRINMCVCVCVWLRLGGK